MSITIENKLESIRSEMITLQKEAQDRLHEPTSNQNHLRMWAHFIQIEESLRTIAWALNRQINPHGDFLK